jgi:hypothetical protein
MAGQRINTLSGRIFVALSVLALLTGVTGFFQPFQADEAAGAHVFQLSIAALFPVGLLYLATADWKQPRRTARPLAVSAAVLGAALSALYYLEHYFHR